MAKIVDEPKLLRYDMLDEECQADIDDPNTETTEADIRRDVHVIAPQVFAGATTIEE
jgi:hypothetical protein